MERPLVSNDSGRGYSTFQLVEKVFDGNYFFAT